MHMQASTQSLVRGHRPSYRDALLAVRDRLQVDCPAGLSLEVRGVHLATGPLACAGLAAGLSSVSDLSAACTPRDRLCSELALLQELEAEIYSHVLQHHHPAVEGVAEAIEAERTSADSLHRRALSVLRSPLAWCAHRHEVARRICCAALHTL